MPNRNFVRDAQTHNKINEQTHRAVAVAFEKMAKEGCGDEFIAAVFQRAADIVKTDTLDIDFIIKLQERGE